VGRHPPPPPPADLSSATPIRPSRLAAIARSDGSRASVTRELLALRVKDGILGDFRFTATGDTTTTPITILRAQRGGGLRVIYGYEGGAVDRVIEPPPRLFR
jgi:hypothetical protein